MYAAAIVVPDRPSLRLSVSVTPQRLFRISELSPIVSVTGESTNPTCGTLCRMNAARERRRDVPERGGRADLRRARQGVQRPRCRVERVCWVRMPMSTFVRTDECQDVLGSLEQCAFSLAQARRSERAWKWVVLSLHSALQGAMVCHLSGTEQLGALQERDATRWREWNNKSIQEGDEDTGDPPPERLADASELFKRLHRSAARIEDGCGGVISITEQQNASFKRLHELRNEFSHFSPKGWSIGLGGTKQAIDDVLNIMCLIADDGWPFRHMTEKDRNILRSTIEDVRREADATDRILAT